MTYTNPANGNVYDPAQSTVTEPGGKVDPVIENAEGQLVNSANGNIIVVNGVDAVPAASSDSNTGSDADAAAGSADTPALDTSASTDPGTSDPSASDTTYVNLSNGNIYDPAQSTVTEPGGKVDQVVENANGQMVNSANGNTIVINGDGSGTGNTP